MMDLHKVLRSLDRRAPGSVQYAQIIELYQARASVSARSRFEELLQDAQTQLALLVLFESLMAREKARLEPQLVASLGPSQVSSSEARNDRRLLNALLLLLCAAPDSAHLSLYQTVALHVSFVDAFGGILALFSVQEYKILQTTVKFLTRGIDACSLFKTSLAQSPRALENMVALVSKIASAEPSGLGLRQHAQLVLRVLTLFRRLVRAQQREASAEKLLSTEQFIFYFASFSLILGNCTCHADPAIVDALLDLLAETWQALASSWTAEAPDLASVYDVVGTLLSLFGSVPIEQPDLQKKIIRLLEELLFSNLQQRHLKTHIRSLERHGMPLLHFLNGTLVLVNARIEAAHGLGLTCILRAFRILKRLLSLVPLSAALFDAVHLGRLFDNKYLLLYQAAPKLAHYLFDLLSMARPSVPLFYHCISKGYLAIAIDLFCFYSESNEASGGCSDRLVLLGLDIISGVFSFKEFVALVVHHPVFFDRFICLFMELSSAQLKAEACHAERQAQQTALLDLIFKCIYHWGSKPLFAEAFLNHLNGKLILHLSRYFNRTARAASKALCEKCLFRLLSFYRASAGMSDSICYYLLRPFLEARTMKSINKVSIKVLKIEIENIQSSCALLFLDHINPSQDARMWSPDRIFKEATVDACDTLLQDMMGHFEACFRDENCAYAVSYLAYLLLSRGEKRIELCQEPPQPLATPCATHAQLHLPSSRAACMEIQFIVGIEATLICCSVERLATCSTVFRHIAGLGETSLLTIRLPNIAADALKTVIQCLYSESALVYLRSLKVSTDLLLGLHALAHAFQLLELERTILFLIWELASQDIELLRKQADPVLCVLSYDRFEWLSWMEPEFVAKVTLLYLLRFPHYMTYGYCAAIVDRTKRGFAIFAQL